MEYTISEMIDIIVDYFKIATYNETYKGKYRKQIVKTLNIGDFKEIDEDLVPIYRKRAGAKYSEKALDYVMFDDTEGDYMNTLTPIKYWENESKPDNYVPVKKDRYYDSEVTKIENERKVIFPDLDWEEEMRLSQLDDEKFEVSNEEFQKKKNEIMTRAVFDMFFDLDEERIYKDMHAYLINISEHTSENRRSIDDLENYPHRYVNFKTEINPKFKKRLQNFINDN